MRHLPDLRPQATGRQGDDLVEHLRTFRLDLKFSAGVWFMSPPDSRFHDRYGPELPIPERLDIAARLKDDGLAAIEAHYPNEIHAGNCALYRDFTRDTGIRLVTVIPLLFRDAAFEFGSLSSPIATARRKAIEITRDALQLNAEMETDFAVVWPGIDGYENPFGIDVASMRRRFADGLAEAMDAVPGVRIAFEPKPYEPRGRILFGSTSEGLLLAHMIEPRLAHPRNRALLDEGHALVAMNPEIGHALMGYEDLPSAFGWPLSEGRLAHIHMNSQPLGNYDQDLIVGSVSPEQLEALLLMLKMRSYRGYFGIDILPERIPVETALRISMDAVRAANHRIEEMDFESIVHAVEHPDRARGWIEAYLVRARAPHPERLRPLPRLGN